MQDWWSYLRGTKDVFDERMIQLLQDQLLVHDLILNVLISILHSSNLGHGDTWENTRYFVFVDNLQGYLSFCVNMNSFVDRREVATSEKSSIQEIAQFEFVLFI